MSFESTQTIDEDGLPLLNERAIRQGDRVMLDIGQAVMDLVATSVQETDDGVTVTYDGTFQLGGGAMLSGGGAELYNDAGLDSIRYVLSLTFGEPDDDGIPESGVSCSGELERRLEAGQ